MTRSANPIRTALAAALAGAVLAGAAVPAQAEYQRAPHGRSIKPKPKSGRVSYQSLWLKCTPKLVRGSLKPFVVNNSGRTLVAGTKIHWQVSVATGAVYKGTLTLHTPLYAGHSRNLMGSLQVKFRCQASLFVV